MNTMPFQNKRVAIIILATLALFAHAIFLRNCTPSREEKTSETKTYALYSARDTFIQERNYYKTIPKVDRKIRIADSLGLEAKLKRIGDSLSAIYFNDLQIEVDLKSNGTRGKVAHINLLEKPGYNGPGSLAPYESWYDFFQGSSGGQSTTVSLKTSFLQPDCNEEWINGLIFFYQGDSIGLWDHLNLSGYIKRK